MQPTSDDLVPTLHMFMRHRFNLWTKLLSKNLETIILVSGYFTTMHLSYLMVSFGSNEDPFDQPSITAAYKTHRSIEIYSSLWFSRMDFRALFHFLMSVKARSCWCILLLSIDWIGLFFKSAFVQMYQFKILCYQRLYVSLVKHTIFSVCNRVILQVENEQNW